MAIHLNIVDENNIIIMSNANEHNENQNNSNEEDSIFTQEDVPSEEDVVDDSTNPDFAFSSWDVPRVVAIVTFELFNESQVENFFKFFLRTSGTVPYL